MARFTKGKNKSQKELQIQAVLMKVASLLIISRQDQVLSPEFIHTVAFVKIRVSVWRSLYPNLDLVPQGALVWS